MNKEHVSIDLNEVEVNVGQIFQQNVNEGYFLFVAV